MKNVEKSARERLVGKPLIGFQARQDAVRAPAIKAVVSEVKPVA